MKRPLGAPLRCAHAGWTGSTADTSRLVILAGWTHEHSLPGARAPIVDVKFDLVYEGGPDPRYGADFLSDRRVFEIVVLHHLFSEVSRSGGIVSPVPVPHGP